MEWRARLEAEAESCLARLASSGDDFEIDAEQSAYRGGTHFVTFGRHAGRPAVFKYFVAARRWQNESVCLQLLQGLGFVPTVFYEEPGQLIAMERLGGTDVMSVLLADDRHRPALANEIGRAFGRLVSFPLPQIEDYDPLTDFPDWGWDRGLRSVVARCGSVGREVAATFGVEHCKTLEASLARIEDRLPEIERERWTLFHEDITNMRVEGDAFVGLYDLELCRGGTPSMQLGAALNLCLHEGSIRFNDLLVGFEEHSGPVDRDSILAMHHLSRWLRICAAPTPDERHEEAATSAETMVAAARAIGT